jgi:phosphoglycerol transferase MdoB-like AlkP superfamily enzyme
MWLYFLAERKPLALPAAPFARVKIGSSARPPIVVVQSESFFDARRLEPQRATDVFANFDRLCAAGESGPLAVPVWGAYTMRTEFAFLSGIAPRELGVHRFNPYRRLAHAGVPTIASTLRQRGYRTVCIHPYPATFFGRHQVFPALGFDEFIDDFAGAPREGAYVSDAALAERIVGELGGGPVFVFAITMENHGPLHLETRAGEDEFGAYLRHLANADAMFGALADHLARAGDGVLCVYGDHVPGLSELYAARGYADPRTDYLIWRAGRSEPLRAERSVEKLAFRLLARAGLATSPG